MIFVKNDRFYYCNMCGKISHDLYGNNPIDKGWDESCAMHATKLRCTDRVRVPEMGEHRKEYLIEQINDYRAIETEEIEQ